MREARHVMLLRGASSRVASPHRDVPRRHSNSDVAVVAESRPEPGLESKAATKTHKKRKFVFVPFVLFRGPSNFYCRSPLGFAPDYFPFVRLASAAIFTGIDESRQQFVLTHCRSGFG